ncbi:MAG: hypothetical protein Q8R18_00300 [bacterium]|nr:hypothetical protein [bacterium]
MALNYSMNWRKARGGIEGVVDLERENTHLGSFEIDTIWYLKDNTLRKNILYFNEDGKISLRDRRISMHPKLESFVVSFNVCLFSLSAGQVAVSLLSENSFYESFSSFHPGLFAGVVLGSILCYRKPSQASLEAWRLYKGIISVEL